MSAKARSSAFALDLLTQVGSAWSRSSLGALLALSAVAVGLGFAILALWLRRRWAQERETEAAEQEPHRVCPTCTRKYPDEARFCAVDATPLAWVEGALAEARLACPRCDHVYDAGIRFCPLDAEELLRVEVDPEASGEGRHIHSHDLSGSDMICPVCAARYEVAAAFCGRDGTRLCPLH